MSFKTILFLDEGEIPSYSSENPKIIKVLDLDYGFSQNVDSTSFSPTEKPKGGMISLVIESSKNDDLIDWMMNAELRKSGTIAVLGRESEGAMRKLVFRNAYCVQFHERFRSVGSSPMQTFLTISCGELQVDGNLYKSDGFPS